MYQPTRTNSRAPTLFRGTGKAPSNTTTGTYGLWQLVSPSGSNRIVFDYWGDEYISTELVNEGLATDSG